MVLIIPGQLDNLNDYTTACRSKSWQAGAAMKKKNEKKITKEIKKQLEGQHIIGAAELNFKWYEPNKKRDLDNVCFAKKFILDALVAEQVIESDGWRGVRGFTDSFFIDAKNPRIEVEIKGAQNEN